MADTADAGTIQINLALNLAPLEKGVQDANKKLGSISGILEKEFAKAGGSLGNFGERIGNVGKNIKKMFGDEAPKVMQDFGRQVERALGLTEKQVKALGQTAEALEGAFKLAGQAVQFIVSPLGVALAMGMSLVAVFGAIRNAMGKVSDGGKEESTGIWGALKQGWNDSLGGRAISGVKSWYDQQAATPGTLAETFHKMDPLKDVSDGFKTGLKDLTGALGPVLDTLNKFMEPGESKKDIAKRAKDLDKQIADAVDALADEQLDAAKANVQMQKDVYEFDRNWNEAEKKLIAKKFKVAYERHQAEMEYEKNRQESLKKIDEQIKAETSARWSAVGSGQFGTAFGMKGTAGAAMNIVGGAFAGAGQNTSAVLQGASQGGQAGGPWGALIGAIVALATKTESFRKILDMVENVLGDILPLLDSMLKPVLMSLEQPMKILSTVFKLFGKLAGMLDNVLAPLEAMNGALMSLFDAIGSLVEMIGSIDIGMEGGLGGGKAEYKGENEFGMSWLTMEAEFKLLSGWIKDETKNWGKGRPVDEWNWEKNIGTEQLGEWAGSKIKVAAGDDRDMYGVHQAGAAGYKEVYGFNSQKDFDAALAKYKESLFMGMAAPKSIGELGTSATAAENQLKLMNNGLYKLAEAGAFTSNALLGFAQQTRNSELTLQVLSTAEGEQAYIDAQIAAAEEQQKRAELDAKVQEELAARGLATATDKAAESLRAFSDSLINAAPGYRLAATGYNSQQAGGPTQGMSGSGGLFNQPVQVYVTLDGQQLAASVEYRQSRNQGMLGSSLATRGPLGLGG